MRKFTDSPATMFQGMGAEKEFGWSLRPAVGSKRNVMGNGRWISGRIGALSYEALIFPIPSSYGIDDGYISKLHIRDGAKQTVLNYDRGWDVRAGTPDVQNALRSILSQQDQLRKQYFPDWKEIEEAENSGGF